MAQRTWDTRGRLAGHTHACAPRDWRTTADLTGSYELDAAVARCKNPASAARLHACLTEDEAYGPISGYSGYRGYRGDN